MISEGLTYITKRYGGKTLKTELTNSLYERIKFHIKKTRESSLLMSSLIQVRALS